MAVLVNDTNLFDAVWIPFNAVPYVLLGTNDGTYQVEFGFAGSDGQTNWTSASVTLDTTPPIIVITNLTNLSGSRPFIDPAGYSTKGLSRLTFNVTNSLGAVYSDQGSVFDQEFNPADMNHTTNWFACLDVALTTGTNFIGINAVDWAGNVTMTNFSYVFDTNGDTTPPTVALTWPQSGMEISGNSFTLRGTLDDDTATVSGQWTDTNGITNTISGLVERGGQFWLENLPLNPGTNTITVAATDAAGNSSTTNLTLIQSSVTLAMDTVSADQLNQVMVNVTGEISDPTYAVWVNGVQGTNTGDGYWSANNVPVTAGGTASFDITAYPPAYAPSGDSWTNFTIVESVYPNPIPADPTQAHVDWDKQSVVYVKKKSFYVSNYSQDAYGTYYTGVDNLNWTQGGGGNWNNNGANTNSVSGDSGTSFYVQNWSGDAGDTPVIHGLGYDYVTSHTPSTDHATTYFTNDDIGTPDVEWIDTTSSSGIDAGDAPDYVVPITWTAVGGQVVELFTGGKALRQSKSLFVLSQSLATLEYSIWDETGLSVSDIAPGMIAMGTLGYLSSNGTLTNAFANGQNVVITARAPEVWYGGSAPGQQKFTLHILQGSSDVTGSNVTAIVGEQMILKCQLEDPNGNAVTTPAITNFQWAVPGMTFSNYEANYQFGKLYTEFPTNNNTVEYYWINGGNEQVSCDVIVAGQSFSAKTKFNVLRPTAKISAWTTSVNLLGGTMFYQFTQTNPLMSGITFSNTISIPHGFSGTNEFIQLDYESIRNLQDTNLVWHILTEVSAPPNLDTVCPYNVFDTNGYPEDNPGSTLDLGSEKFAASVASDNFEMWMMFKPDGGQWVPLRAVNWSWGGSATNSIPYGDFGWSLVSRTNSINPLDFDQLSHPEWQNNVTNATWIPSL
jgi:hypothetical protein